MRKALLLAPLIITGVLFPVSAQDYSLPAIAGPPAIYAGPEEAPMFLGRQLPASEAASLGDAFEHAVDSIRVLEETNASGRVPLVRGFVRPLPTPFVYRSEERPEILSTPGVDFPEALEKRGHLFTWATRIDVEGSHRLRVHLSDTNLPLGTRLWVYGEAGRAVGPILVSEILHEGSLWTPSVDGPSIFLELRFPEHSAVELSFAISEIAELFELDSRLSPVRFKTQPDISCARDATCYGNSTLNNIESLRRSVAYLEIVKGGQIVLCTGNLLNNTQQDFTPYLLTANHCLSSQTSAASLEAFWDYRPATCGGTLPPWNSLPRSSGATLLATGQQSDFTLVKLNNLPGNRVFLGQTTSMPTGGTTVHRVSHPLGYPQAYSSTKVVSSPPSSMCGLSTSNFLVTDPLGGIGSAFPGSSGAADVNSQLQVVGQLMGACGPNVDEPCLGILTDYHLDGRYDKTWPHLAPFLAGDGGTGGSGGSGGSGTQPCNQTLSNGVLCLGSGLFELSMTWTDFNNQTSPVIWQKYTDQVGLGVFQNNLNDVTLAAKVTNGCPINGKHWIWLGAFTASKLDLTVRNTATGQTKSYGKSLGSLMTTIKDDFTFPCN